MRRGLGLGPDGRGRDHLSVNRRWRGTQRVRRGEGQHGVLGYFVRALTEHERWTGQIQLDKGCQVPFRRRPNIQNKTRKRVAGE